MSPIHAADPVDAGAPPSAPSIEVTPGAVDPTIKCDAKPTLATPSADCKIDPGITAPTAHAEVGPTLLRDSLSVFTVTLVCWTILNAITGSGIAGFWAGLGTALKADMKMDIRPAPEWIAEKTGGNEARIRRWLHAVVGAFARALTVTVTRALLIIFVPMIAMNIWAIVIVVGLALMVVAFPQLLFGLVQGIRKVMSRDQLPDRPTSQAATPAPSSPDEEPESTVEKDT